MLDWPWVSSIGINKVFDDFKDLLVWW